MDTALMGHFTMSELRDFLNREFFSMGQVMAWNQRKNGREGHQFVSRYDGPRNPDDDFIDLDAMIRNVVRSVWDELKRDDGDK